METPVVVIVSISHLRMERFINTLERPENERNSFTLPKEFQGRSHEYLIPVRDWT